MRNGNHDSQGFCARCMLRNRAVCADLEPSEIALLNSFGQQRRLAPGELLAWNGSEAPLVANVLEGALKESSWTVDGREQILRLALPGDFVGRPFRSTASYEVGALVDTLVCVFPRGKFEQFMLEHPRLEHKLLERTLAQLDEARGTMLLLGCKSAEQKVATFLMDMRRRLTSASNDRDNRNSTAFELPLNRRQVAEMLGLTIETVSRKLTAFRDQGLIELPTSKQVLIRDPRALESRAG